MKWTIYIFSFWLLLLAGLPCPDADCHIHENVTASTSASHSDKHEHGHKAPCSPFCHCTTCVGFSIPRLFSYVATSEISTRITSGRLFTYQSPAHADVAIAIWQPPKL